jgi:hypothetical protein|nr:MAG TPA: late control gene D protein [Caudoviricetes sp.]DAX27551.1 MAG TPA: late control gene D protein [Caudoviricetes sp.]
MGFEALSVNSQISAVKGILTDKKSNKSINLNQLLLKNIEISYSGVDIEGYIIIDDIADINNALELGSDVEIQLYFKDLFQKEYYRTFIITGKNTIKQGNKTLLQYSIRDIISYKLDNIFKAKSYNSVKISDIFQEFLQEVNEYITKDKLKINIEQSKERALYSVNPSVSFLDFITNDLEREGFIVYQTRDSINVKSARNLKVSNLSKQKYRYIDKTNNTFYQYKIFEYKQLNSSNRFQPKTICLVYNPATKTMDKFQQNLSDISSDIQISKSTPKAQETSGVRYTTKEYLDDNSLYADTFKNFVRESGLEIIVSGDFTQSNQYNIIELKISGNINVKESQDKGDTSLSGNYIILKVVDKIVSGTTFIQKLILGRL